MPLGVTTALVLAGILLRRRFLCLAGILVLWVAAMPVTSNPFIRMIEGNAVRMAAEDMPKVDAIVVLSGGRVTAPGDPPVSEWNDGDRFFGGIELFRAGKAPLLIFTDGWSPWRPDRPKPQPSGWQFPRIECRSGPPDPGHRQCRWRHSSEQRSPWASGS